MIETYKIITGKYYAGVAPTLLKGSTSIIKGNDLRLQKSHVKYNLHKFGFAEWFIHGTAYRIWLCLLILLSNTFKSRPDKFWQNQDVKNIQF